MAFLETEMVWTYGSGYTHGFFIIVLSTIVQGRPQDLFNMKQIRNSAFSRFWLGFSDPDAVPPPPDQLEGSAALVPPLLQQATGDVLEIGPGSGGHLRYFNRNVVENMYAAEPTVGLHEALRRQAARAGLADRYQVFDCGAEMNSLVPKLAKEGLFSAEPHERYGECIFDTIISIRILCSVTEPEQTVENLYRLLKPGGKLLVLEHVVNPWMTGDGNVIARAVQMLYHSLGWSFFMGDCHMNRDTAKTLRDAARSGGGWSKVDLKPYFGWSTLCYVSGQLVK